MSDRASLRQVAALVAYAGDHGWLPAAVQTRRCGGGDGPLAEWIAGFLLNGYFFDAIILYAALTVLRVWILSFNQLSRAH
jgi:hypothetical protein